MQRDIQLGLAYEKVRAYVAGKDRMSTLGLACSFWYEHGLCSFPFAYGFDVEKKAVTFYDDSNTKISTSTWPQCGPAVARLLSLPVLPDDEDDKSLTLDHFRDKHAYISSFFVSQKENSPLSSASRARRRLSGRLSMRIARRGLRTDRRRRLPGIGWGLGRCCTRGCPIRTGVGTLRASCIMRRWGCRRRIWTSIRRRGLSWQSPGMASGIPSRWGRRV
jgi:hypothetical protein